MKLKHVHEYVAKGRVYRYFRHGKSKVRLLGEPDSTEFWSQYQELLRLVETERTPTAPGTIAALITDYKRSPEYADLAPATRHAYAVDLDRLAIIGAGRVTDIRRAHVLKLRDELADRPRAADHFVQVARLLLSWAVNRGYMDVNPLLRVKSLNKPTSYATWTDDECSRYEASDPPETLLTPYMLGRYTGQRRGDVLRMTRRQYDGSAIEVKQGKTGAELWIPCHARLRAYLDALPADRLLFCVTQRGKPWLGSSFSHEIAKHLANIGLAHLSFHGLRHTAATALADAGCSDRDIMAITGHKTAGMVRRYTQKADQRARASAAILRLESKRGG